MHSSHSTMGDKPRRVCGGERTVDRGAEAWKPEEIERFHTEKWISTPVPAPKRSTLGVVAALDSVVGLCSGIESNISTNKHTQSDVHGELNSNAFSRMSQEERRGEAERADTLIIKRVRAAVCLLSAMQYETVLMLKG